MHYIWRSVCLDPLDLWSSASQLHQWRVSRFSFLALYARVPHDPPLLFFNCQCSVQRISSFIGLSGHSPILVVCVLFYWRPTLRFLLASVVLQCFWIHRYLYIELTSCCWKTSAPRLRLAWKFPSFHRPEFLHPDLKLTWPRVARKWWILWHFMIKWWFRNYCKHMMWLQ